MLHISMNTAKKYNIMPPRHKISEQKSRQCCIFFEKFQIIQHFFENVVWIFGNQNNYNIAFL